MNDEWAVMKAIFDEYGMRNFFYDKTPEGQARERNREIVMQIQDLWYDEGARAWERLHVKGTTKQGQDLERADGSHNASRDDVPWQMDIFALIGLLRTLVTKKETEPSDDLVHLPVVCCGCWDHTDGRHTHIQESMVEVALKQELSRQVMVGKHKKNSELPAEVTDLNVMRIVDLVEQLTGLPDGQGGLVEKLIPGTARSC
jgi:hypothetical protein